MTDSKSDLRQWRLPRGRHGLPRELVARSQRERLLAAVVRVAASNGYESTSVADILEEAGVGRESFYELFEDKKECLLSARAILVDDLNATVAAVYNEPGPWPERVRNTLAAMLGWFAADPAAAKVVVVEVAAVGAASRELFQSDFARFTKLMDDGLEQPEPVRGLPRVTALAIAAALARVYEEVVRDRTAQLPALLPELTYELLVPFIGEETAMVEEDRAAEMLAAAE
ncbi:MAG: helix-turn-helix domain-containing protein [Solirubrobacterales bacterium]